MILISLYKPSFTKLIAAIFVIFPGHYLCAQTARSPLSVPYTSIGTYSKKFATAFAGSFNQASLAYAEKASAGIYGDRRFMLKELSIFAAAVSLPVKAGGIGISVNYFGGENFNTAQTGIGYGKRIGDKIAIGIQFNYNHIKLSGYGSSGTVNFEAGAIMNATEKLHFGVHVYNPVGGKFGKDKSEKIASVYTTGIGYDVSDNFFLTAEIAKEEDKPVNINAGVQYVFAKQLFARLGIATATGNYFFGLGLQWKTVRIDMTTSWHPQLGFTPGIMLLFNFHEPVKSQQD